MPVVTLSDIPDTGTDLEHYIAALFQAAGYYVEKGIIHRDPADVLELDIVATDYRPAPPWSVVVEAKGGDWGWADVFKLLGWTTYLGIRRGAMFVKGDNGKPIDKMNEKLGIHDLSVSCFENYEDPYEPPFPAFTEAGFGAPREELVPLFRYSYEIERRLTRLVAKTKDSDGAKAAITYQRLVNDGLFFANDCYQQLSMLYEAYKEHPKLTAATAREMDGQEFDAQAIAANSVTMHQALYEGHHPLLQACMFFEHRARLALLKTAIDLTLERPSGLTLAVVDPGGDIDWNLFLIHTLPSTFKAGQAWLAEQPNFKLYATFWQQFLWGWGGFYLEHRKEEEFAWMSEYSGIPVDEIPTALQAFDKFFPIGEWIARAGWSDIMVVRMAPWYFQGLGAAYRRVKYGADKFSELAGSGYTATDLSRRMTLTRDFLST